MTAFIAVTMTAFACDNGNKSHVAEKQISSANLNYLMPGSDDKTESEMKTEYTNEGLYADSIGKPETPGEKQKQQHPQKPPPAIQPDWDKKNHQNSILECRSKRLQYILFFAS